MYQFFQLIIAEPCHENWDNITPVEKGNPLVLATKAEAFNVFPNFILSGNNLIIEWKETEEGYYTLQLLNQSSQPAHQQDIWIDSEARLLNIDVPELATGNYFLVLVNKKQGRSFRRKLFCSRLLCLLQMERIGVRLSKPRMKLLQRLSQKLPVKMSINFSSGNACMPQHFLYGTQVGTAFYQMCGE